MDPWRHTMASPIVPNSTRGGFTPPSTDIRKGSAPGRPTRKGSALPQTPMGSVGTTRKGRNATHDAQRQVSKAGSGGGAIFGALGGGRLRRLGAGLALLAGMSAAVPAHADYVRLDQGRPVVVESELTAPIQQTGVEFEPGRAEEYPLFKIFWDSDTPGTSHRGVDGLTPEGVGHLLEYARTHDLDGTRLASASDRAGPIQVTAGHSALIRFMLEDPRHSAFITQEAVPLLRAGFNLPEVEIGANPNHAPVDAGEVRVCSDAEWWGSQGINGWAIRNFANSISEEYRLGTRVDRYENVPLETRKYEMTCLLYQFGRALNAWDDTALATGDRIKHQVQEELLDAFFKLPVFDERRFGADARALLQFFATDFNGSGMGLAQAIAKGFEPNDFPTEFRAADNRSSPTRLSMSTSNLASGMVALDRIRVADGRDPAAVELKSFPSLGYMVGEPSGHHKITFNEASPPLDRLNYGKMIQVGSQADGFANDARLGELPVKPGFTFPIDAITATGQAVEANSTTRLHVVRADNGRPLDVEVVIHEEDGEPAHWSLQFSDPVAGQSVPASEVVGLLKTPSGRVLGDGHANQTLETGYWGQCDDNGGSDQLFGRFPDLPRDFIGQTDRQVYIRVGGELVAIPKDDARDLVYMDLPGIGGTQNPVDGGYRFGYDPTEVRWQRGTTIYTNFGELVGFTPSPFTQTNHRFVDEDVLRIHNTPSEPILGSLRLEGQTIDAAQVRFIMNQGDEVRVIYQSGTNFISKSGVPITDLSHLDWSAAELGSDPDAANPGRKRAAEDVQPGETLQMQYEKFGLAELDVTASQFLRANPDVLARPAQSMLPNEKLALPEVTLSIAADGNTVAEQLAAFEAVGANKIARANQDALAAIVIPQLEVGATVHLRVGDGDVQHEVVEGDTWASVLAAHATPEHDAASIDAATREARPSFFRTWDRVALPEGASVELKIPAHQVEVGGEAPRTIAQALDRSELAPFGYTLAAVQESNAAVAERPAGWVKSGENLVVPERFLSFSADVPFSGEFQMNLTTGKNITFRADEVDYIQGETPHDVRFSHYVSFVQRAEGVYVNEGSLARGISNARKWIDSIETYVTQGADRPAFSGSADLVGIRGPLERQPGDKMVFQAGLGGANKVFAGWMQIDERTGRVLNEGFTYGEPDFVWGAHDVRLNWHAPSTYIGSAMDPQYRIALFVNGVPDLRNQTEEGLKIAERLNLPSNWTSYIVSDADVEAHVEAERAAAAAAAEREAPGESETPTEPQDAPRDDTSPHPG